MFGKDAYSEILKAFTKKGFTFEYFFSKKKSRVIYLRHDIDFSVQKAHELALFERELGVVSTYFFMLTSNTYNLLSAVNQSLVKEIKSFGHEVSLHFDPLAYNDIDKGFSAERKVFEEVFNVNIKMVSIHRPGVFLQNRNKSLGDCRHTYEDEFFDDMMYISDSGGRDIAEELIKVSRSDVQLPLHILLHPIWWTSKTSSPTATLSNWLDEHKIFLIEETRHNCKTFKG